MPIEGWFVPVDDGGDPARIEIRDRVVPPCVLLNLGSPTRLMTPVEAAQLGQALQDAGRVAAQTKSKRARPTAAGEG